MSLLNAHGHPQARRYPVPHLWAETAIVQRRVNRDFATAAVLTQLAISAQFSKKGSDAFGTKIKKLMGK